MTRHSPETKAAVLAALLTGQGVSAVAREYQLPQQTVSRWNDEVRGLLTRTSGLQKSDEDDIGDAVGRYLRTALRTLVVQLEHVADRAWLQEQDAADLAVLHGVLVDKVIRILEAAEAARGQPGDVIDVDAVHPDTETAGVP